MRIFTGRLNRSGFLLANFYWGLLLLVAIIIYLLLGFSNRGHGPLTAVVFVVGLILIAFLIVCGVFSVAFLARRFHDIGQTGWLALLTLIPGGGTVLFIVLLILPGTAGQNKYGDAPQPSLGFRDVSGL